jgi:hypothetical protein
MENKTAYKSKTYGLRLSAPEVKELDLTLSEMNTNANFYIRSLIREDLERRAKERSDLARNLKKYQENKND